MLYLDYFISADEEQQTALQLTAVHRPAITFRASVLFYATHNDTSVCPIALFEDVSLSKMRSCGRSGGSVGTVEPLQLSERPFLDGWCNGYCGIGKVCLPTSRVRLFTDCLERYQPSRLACSTPTVTLIVFKIPIKLSNIILDLCNFQQEGTFIVTVFLFHLPYTLYGQKFADT